MSRLDQALAIGLLGTCLSANLGAQAVLDLSISRVAGEGSGSYFYFGEAGGVRAYSMGITFCNVGTLPVPFDLEEVHIGQNLFRYHDGRLEQLGFSWITRSVCPLNESSCGTCQQTDCATLGIGCASTSGSGISDGQHGHGKQDVDATIGAFVQAASTPSGPAAISGRLQVPSAAMGTPGARYVVELQALCQSDHADGNARNNVSWREVETSASVGSLSGAGHTVRPYQCGLEAWAEFEAGVQLVEVVNSQEPTAVGSALGHYVLAYKASDLGAGLWRYEYALQNLTSDQAVRSFSLPLACGATISDLYFHDIDHHSGMPWSDTDWSVSQSGGLLSWSCTETFAQNPDANALRWGELFNFGFTADAPPSATNATLGLFEPGPLAELPAAVEGPCGQATCGTTAYCQGLPNSAGAGAAMGSSGSTSVAANDLVLQASGAIAGQFGLFFYGSGQTQFPFGDGLVCVSGGFFRLNPPQAASAQGTYLRALDLLAPPANAGPGAIGAGSSWNFQLWYRDPAAAGSGFNLSDGLNAVFCP